MVCVRACLIYNFFSHGFSFYDEVMNQISLQIKYLLSKHLYIFTFHISLCNNPGLLVYTVFQTCLKISALLWQFLQVVLFRKNPCY